MVCPRGEREHSAPRDRDILPARGLAWRGRSVVKPTRERAGVCVGAKRSEAPQGRDSAGKRVARADGKAWRGERDQRKHEPRWDER